jgi:hypothetical protein
MAPDHEPQAAGIAWLPQQRSLVALLKRTDPQVWAWFARSTVDPKAIDEVRFDLLKSTYRVERQTQPALYEAADAAASTLGIAAPVTLYQAQDPRGLNASLAYVPGEIHVVLHGPIATQLSAEEVRCLLGHEMTHYALWHGNDGELLTASEMLRALSNDSRAHPAHLASYRLLGLYNEILCDRGAYLVAQDVHAVVSTLVKTATGVSDVSAESYLRQAEEIFAHGGAASEGLTHPEAFIRARAVKLFAEGAVNTDEQIARMIEGSPGLDELDLLEQEKVSAATRRIIDVLLCRRWFQTDAVLSHARLYFEDYVPPREAFSDPNLGRDARIEPASLCDYYCFVLLDFATADRELEEAPLAAALLTGEQLEIKPRLMELARQELRLRKNQIEDIDRQKETILASAEKSLATAP